MEKLKSCQGCFWYGSLLGICINERSPCWHQIDPGPTRCKQYNAFTAEDAKRRAEHRKEAKNKNKKFFESIPKEELERMLSEEWHNVINNRQG